MAYVYCSDCNWSQDDFYSVDAYNPAKSLMDWMESLVNDKDLDKQFSTCSDFVAENGPITKREVIARQFENYAKHIREMHWITSEDFKNDPDKKCPKCGSVNLGED